MLHPHPNPLPYRGKDYAPSPRKGEGGEGVKRLAGHGSGELGINVARAPACVDGGGLYGIILRRACATEPGGGGSFPGSSTTGPARLTGCVLPPAQLTRWPSSSRRAVPGCSVT